MNEPRSNTIELMRLNPRSSALFFSSGKLLGEESVFCCRPLKQPLLDVSLSGTRSPQLLPPLQDKAAIVSLSMCLSVQQGAAARRRYSFHPPAE